MQHPIRSLFASVGAVVLLASCGGGALSSSDGHVRLANFSSSAADLYDDSDRVQSGVAVGAISDYQKVDDGSRTFSIRGGVAGATIASLSASLDEDSHLTLVAYANAGTTTLAAVSEDEDEPDKGMAKLRFFNTATDAGAVDIYLTRTAACAGTLTSDNLIASSVSGLQASYTDINPSGSTGAYRLCVTAAGSTTDLRLDSQLTVGDRDVVSVVLARTGGGVLLSGAALVQDGAATPLANTSARVRLAVGVTASVTASVGSTSLGTVSSPIVGSYQLVSAGSALTVTVDGVAVTPGTATAIAAGTDYTVLVSGDTAASAAVALIADDNTKSTDSANPVRVRLVDGATNGIAASLVIGPDSINGVPRGTASAYINTEASGATATTITVTAGGTVLCTQTATFSTTPTVYSVFALGTVATCTLRADR